jgi:hypothetical protein
VLATPPIKGVFRRHPAPHAIRSELLFEAESTESPSGASANNRAAVFRRTPTDEQIQSNFAAGGT